MYKNLLYPLDFLYFKQTRNFVFLLLSALGSTWSQQSQAAEIFNTETISVENRSPVIQLFSLSRPDYSIPDQQGEYRWKPRLELTNYLSATRKQNDFFLIDGETWIVSNTLQYQLSDQTNLQFILPWLRHNAGVADRFIYDFHKIFALPQNGRDQLDNDAMSWVLNVNNSEVLTLNDAQSGIGDVRIKLSWSPESLPDTHITSLIKLPTGKFDKQTGSENVDVGMSIYQSNPDWLKNRSWLSAFPLSLWYGAGINYVGAVDELNELKANRLAATFRTGIAWAASEDWHLKLQFDSNTPLFDSEIRELGWMPVQISMATEYIISEDTAVDLALIEDLRPRASPDIIFTTGLSIRF